MRRGRSALPRHQISEMEIVIPCATRGAYAAYVAGECDIIVVPCIVGSRGETDVWRAAITDVCRVRTAMICVPLRCVVIVPC